MFHTEETITTTTELSKSQTIRLIDVFVIAPFLFYIGYIFIANLIITD